MINGVTMKITMPIATGMVVLVVTMMLADGTITVLHVNALIQITVVQQQLLQQLPQPHLQMAVDPLAGPMICGVMMKTTMLIAIMMVELVASIMPQDGILTAQTVSALSAHHLDGTVITTVMII
jgi:hypothetical protein